MRRVLTGTCILFLYVLVVMTATGLSLYGAENDVERAMRPDAPELGSVLFGPTGCLQATVCCPADTSVAMRCAPTVIVEIGVPQTLTESGTYCLGTDLINPLTISGSSITLEMNGYTIFPAANQTGITISSGVEDVRVFGGLVDGQASPATTTGIAVGVAASDVRIEDVTCVSCNEGIVANVMRNLVLNRVIASNNTMAAISAADGDCIYVTDGIFRNNGLGISVTRSSNILILRCLSELNTLVGFSISESDNFEIIDSTVRASNGDGISLDEVQEGICRNTFTTFNTGNGISVTGISIDISFFNCLSNENSLNGFSFAGDGIGLFNGCSAMDNLQSGFMTSNGTAIIMVRECVAVANGGYGFNNVRPANQFYSNVACDNTLGQYNGVTSAAVAGPFNADGVDNVDCSILAPPSVTCDATPIFNTGVTQFLTNSGRYCLVEDLTAGLSIMGDSISLDLNGHVISLVTLLGTCVFVDDNVMDIHIYNGLLDGNGSASFGVFVRVASDVTIENIVCQNFTDCGIRLQESIRTVMNHVCCHSSQYGMRLEADIGTTITNSDFSRNATSGVLCEASHNLIMRLSRMDRNRGVAGFEAHQSITGDICRIELYNCSADSNGRDPFFISSVHGFSFVNSQVVLVECTSQFNTSNGFFFRFPNVGGYDISYIHSCIALRNLSAGYDNGLGVEASNQFYSNMGVGNGGPDFIGVVSASVTALPSTAGYWQNIGI